MSDIATTDGGHGYSAPAKVTVDLSLDPPLQRRGTILVRWLLALPLAFAGFGIFVAAFFWLIGAWFSALFTKRVPDGLQVKLLGVLQFQARLTAYVDLLTDVWPGVHFVVRPDDPVAVGVDHVELRRAAVFFRFILGIPAWFISSAVATGIYPFLVVMWIIGLVRGRTPRRLHQTAALVLRFTMRTSAYSLLLTPTQPFRGFFGDAPALVPDLAASAPLRESPTEPPPPQASEDHPLRPSGPWVVERGVNVLLIIVLVLGIAGQSANNRWDSHHPFGFYFNYYSSSGTSDDKVVVTNANNAVVAATDAFIATTAQCASVSCVTSAASTAEGKVGAAITTLENSYTASPSSNTRYVKFLSILTSDQGLLTTMSQSGTTVERDRQLLAKLLSNQKALYTAAVDLVNQL